jgi:ATP-dependent Clp endopeptidase proteolytic subunit ClpP
MPEIQLYGVIGDELDGLDSATIREQIQQSSGPLDVRINSGGGFVHEGLAIHTALAQYPDRVTVTVDGIAASMASAVAMAGDQIRMAENALLMVHDPWSGAIGNSEELRKEAETLDKIRDSLVGIYARRTGADRETVTAWMNAETWFDAEDALAAGLADEILEPVAAAALTGFDLSSFHNVPAALKTLNMEKTMATETNAQAPNQNSTQAPQDFKAQEKARRSEIRERFGHFGEQYPELLDQCLDDPDVTPDKAASALLDAMGQETEPMAPSGYDARPNPSVRAGDNRLAEMREAASDALLVRAGIKHDSEANPAAKDFRRSSLVDIAARFLERQGSRAFGNSPTQIMDAAFAATGTDNFPALLRDAAHKAIMQGYDMEPASHAQWTREVEAPDFKTLYRAQRSEAPALENVPEHAEYTQGSITDREESYSIDTYGRIFAISRQALVNDDLQAFTDLPQAFGASARRLEADHVYNLLIDNPTMSDGNSLFDETNHGNLFGTGSSLSVSSLGEAKAKMRTQKGLQGQAILNLAPRYLIVPAALETDAEQLLASLVDPGQNNDAQTPAWIRGLELVVDARLDADSETAWYLAGSYQQVDTVERAYLQGANRIQIMEETAFDTDAFRIKARLDFAAAVLDWKGLVKNPGA